MFRLRLQHGPDKSPRRVRRMFASIAKRYDFLNHLLSLNIDRSWRTFTTRIAAPAPGTLILDCCTGTADLALAFDRATDETSPIVATDFCREMLVLGRAKIEKANASARITLIESDAAAASTAQQHLRRRERGLRPSQRRQYRPWHRRAHPGDPAWR